LATACPVGNLELLRRAGGWSAKEFAQELGISPSMLSRLESGQLSPTLHVQVQTLETLQRRLARIVFGPTAGNANPERSSATMALRPTQKKSGFPRSKSTNPTKRSGRDSGFGQNQAKSGFPRSKSTNPTNRTGRQGPTPVKRAYEDASGDSGVTVRRFDSIDQHIEVGY
jgi:transcriptional regulator with XRE-family HTH domain